MKRNLGHMKSIRILKVIMGESPSGNVVLNYTDETFQEFNGKWEKFIRISHNLLNLYKITISSPFSIKTNQSILMNMIGEKLTAFGRFPSKKHKMY